MVWHLAAWQSARYSTQQQQCAASPGSCRLFNKVSCLLLVPVSCLLLACTKRTEATIPDSVVALLDRQAIDMRYPSQALRVSYDRDLNPPLRQAMATAGQAYATIERGLIMSGDDGRAFVLRGFFQLQRSLNDSRAAVPDDCSTAFYSYLNTCLVLAHLGEQAVLHADAALLENIMLQLNLLRKQAHTRFAFKADDSGFDHMPERGALWVSGSCKAWVFWDGDPPAADCARTSFSH